MALQEIYVDQVKIDEEVAKVTAKVAPLQEIYDEMVSLGVTAPTLDDIETLQGNEVNESILKGYVLRDKTLQVSGISLGPAAVVLNPTLVASLRQKFNTLKGISYSYYEIIASEIVVISTLEADIRPSHITTGTELAAEVIDDVAPIAAAINAVLDKINPHHTSPMRDPEEWLKYNPTTKHFSVDIFNIARHVV